MEELAAITQAELRAVTVGVDKQRPWWYELGLYVAWHVAVFTSQVKAGQLKEWSQVRTTLLGSQTEKNAPVPWQTTQAERRRQMTLMKKHQTQRRKVPVRRAKNHV